MNDEDERMMLIAIMVMAIIVAFIAGALTGVSWYDSKYRPEIERYLKDCVAPK